MHVAIQFNQLEGVKWLIKHGAKHGTYHFYTIRIIITLEEGREILLRKKIIFEIYKSKKIFSPDLAGQEWPKYDLEPFFSR